MPKKLVSSLSSSVHNIELLPIDVVCKNVGSNHEIPNRALLFSDSLESLFQHISMADANIFIEKSQLPNSPAYFTRYTDTEDFLIFSVLTSSAAKTSLAHHIVDFLQKIVPLDKSLSPNITTAVHEAIQNAVIHGNCEIHSLFKNIEDFERYYRAFEECLSNPVYSNRRLTIELGIGDDQIILAISDEGKGYISSIQGSQPQTKPHGLGLEIISLYCSQYSFLPGGNTLILWFDLQSPPYKIALDYQRAQLKESLKSSKILLVDDVDFNLMILQEILSSHGFINFQIARNGKEALEKTQQWRPDLVVLDLIMPELNGFEYCQAVRSNPKIKDIPIVVQTALSIPDQRTKAFEEGATDFISKPIDADEMIARILVHLERQKLFNDLAISRQRMTEELDDARTMQLVILPSQEDITKLSSTYGINIHSHFQTSSELGGDFWGIKPLSSHKISLYCVDFSGHGVTAALNTFRLHTLMNGHMEDASDPGAYLTLLNEGLCQLLSPGQFATMFYAVLDIKSNILSYATAACPRPMIIRQTDKTVECIDTRGFPLGIQSNIPYTTEQTSFYPGDNFCLYSDALIETEDHKRQFFTEEELRCFLEQVAKSMQSLDSSHLFQILMSHFNHNYAINLKDDLTISFFQRHMTC